MGYSDRGNLPGDGEVSERNRQRGDRAVSGQDGPGGGGDDGETVKQAGAVDLETLALPKIIPTKASEGEQQTIKRRLSMQ